MKLSEAVKPISQLKSDAAGIIKDISKNRTSVVITQNGKATAVLQDIHEYEKTQESLALLKILASSQANLKKGKVKPIGKAFQNVRKKIKGLEE